MTTLAPIRSGFMGRFRVCPASGGMARVVSGSYRIEIAWPGFEGVVRTLGDTFVQCDLQQRIVLVLHGDLWRRPSATGLLAEYKRRGMRFVSDLDGSFALLLLDGGRGQAWMATDRVNSRPIFVRRREGVVEVATALSLLSGTGIKVDPVGVAWYLSNGVVHGGRTVLAGVRRVGRAVCERIDMSGSDQGEGYWTPQIPVGHAGHDRAAFKRDLRELLVETVQRTVPDDQPVHISLSAGYDVSGIAGILARRPRHENIRTFSYGLNLEFEGSDAWAARRMAARLGFSHCFQKSHDGDVLAAIERNAAWGDGQANFCDESLAWFQLQKEHEGNSPWLCVGEHFFGNNDMATLCERELLRVCDIRRIADSSWLERMLAPGAFSRLVAEQEADLGAMLERVREAGSIQSARALLYLDQRLPNMLLNWRECFAARAFRVINPWLSADLLDFLGRMPYAWRVGKALYIETIRELLPEVFAEPRAVSLGYVSDWQTELARKRRLLTDVLLTSASTNPLDDVVDPDAVRTLLADCRSTVVPSRLSWHRLRSAAGMLLGSRSANPHPTDAQRVKFLLRYLTLRRFLERTTAQRMSTVEALATSP